LIPLGELPSRMSELDSADDIVLQCKTGGRSAKALKLLREAGFNKLSNLEGGITAWRNRSIPRCRNTDVTFQIRGTSALPGNETETCGCALGAFAMDACRTDGGKTFSRIGKARHRSGGNGLVRRMAACFTR